MTSSRRIQGSCFGFAIESSVPLVDLRDPTVGLPTLAVRPGHPEVAREPPGTAPREPGSGPLIAEWNASTDVRWAGRLHRAADGWDLWVDETGWFGIDPAAGAITVPDLADPLLREERLWSVPAILCLLARGDLPLHAAAIEVDGRAVILVGPRGSGKSTLAGGLVRAGHRLLSEDVVGYRPGTNEVLPGPAMLRIRRDVAGWLDVPGTSALGVVDDRIHLAVEAGSRGDASGRPVAAVVVLDKPGSDTSATRIPATAAVSALWPLASQLPGREGVAQRFERVVDLARAVPAFRIAPAGSVAGLPKTVEAIVTLARSVSPTS